MFIIILLILSVLFIVLSTTKFQLHPFLALLFAAIGFGLFSGMPLSEIVQSINDGFGKTLGFIGIVIILGTIIGTFLENSGGAYAMAEKMLKIIGQKMVPLTMAIIGYVVSIPVFADSGFVILSPLNKALSKRAGISLAGSTVALAVGLTASHTMVPPTPGPIAAAGIIEADLGLVIMFGIPISILSVVVGWLFAKKIAAKTYIDPNPELSEEAIFEKLKTAPSPFKAFIPILLPIVLIILKSVGDLPSKPFGEETLFEVMNFVGNPVIALLIGVLLSFSLPKKFDKKLLSTSGWVGKGLMDAAIIIMITGAGGAFGKVLQNSGIAGLLGDTLANANLGIWLPFVIAAALKSSQGSSTVALITAASIIAPLSGSLGFDAPMEKALLVLAIGAGSAVVSHVNDSFFWVVTQMTGMDVKQGYKLHSAGTGVLGITAAFLIWITSLVIM